MRAATLPAVIDTYHTHLRLRLAVASTSGDAALVDRSAELLEKLASMRIGSNKAGAVPNGDELAKVFQAMLRTT